MGKRLYRLRPDQGVFETGTAQGKQLLLATTVNEILLHWFAPEGKFLNLQRVPIASAPTPHSVKDKAKLQSQVVWGPKWYEELVGPQLVELKERIGFVPGEIAVRKFESEEAAILDLPDEFQEFLDNREDYSEEDQKRFDGYIRQFRSSKCFVLVFSEDYWMSESGEVEHS